MDFFIKRDCRTERKNELGRYLSSVNWDIIDAVEICEDKLSFLEDIIKIGLDHIMPLKETMTHSLNAPWVTPEFIHLIKCRQQYFAKMDFITYRFYRILVNRERKSLREHYFSSKVKHLKNAKPSAWWKDLKNIAGMQVPTSGEDLTAQLHIDNIDKENLSVTTNKINQAFLEPKLSIATHMQFNI